MSLGYTDHCTLPKSNRSDHSRSHPLATSTVLTKLASRQSLSSSTVHFPRCSPFTPPHHPSWRLPPGTTAMTVTSTDHLLSRPNPTPTSSASGRPVSKGFRPERQKQNQPRQTWLGKTLPTALSSQKHHPPAKSTSASTPLSSR
jgi:hypothetical protein